jgi:NAD(P)-dependent dehydrogenase (short-subunit alcohol dehydrogenase family)
MEHGRAAGESDATGALRAVVAGGSSGIGRATVALLARRGVRGTVLDRDPPSHALPSDWAYVCLDLSDVAAIVRTVRDVVLERGAPDLLVNAAGVNGTVPDAFTLDEHEWDRVHDVNLRGAFFLAREVMRTMRDGTGGRIINVASQLGTAVIRPNPHYQIAKAGVIQMTRVLALEGAAHGVQVNVVSPGIVVTPMTERVMADGEWTEDRLARIPLGRFALPEEIAEVIVAVGLLHTPYMTGAEIVVDGGYLLP